MIGSSFCSPYPQFAILFSKSAHKLRSTLCRVLFELYLLNLNMLVLLNLCCVNVLLEQREKEMILFEKVWNLLSSIKSNQGSICKLLVFIS